SFKKIVSHKVLFYILKTRMFVRCLFIFGIVGLIFSCSPGKYSLANKEYKKQAKEFAKRLKQYPLKDSFPTSPDWVGTTNFSMRKPNFVILHHTAQNSCDQTLQTFTLKRTEVSAHYVICKDGTVHHMLNDYFRAWHAGAGRWGNLTDVNSSSIGIELDNNGFEVFPDTQINSLINILTALKNQYNIPVSNFIGHADIAPTRKIDPNVYFPWKLLADKGFGSWYDTSNVVLPSAFNVLENLRIVGYDVRDSSAAIGAFKRHFLQADSSRILSKEDKKILYALAKGNM
ncbi:MAG: N-acetylmuramoyl-L-alanine amidase, partial [Ginsengibacter sp.]